MDSWEGVAMRDTQRISNPNSLNTKKGRDFQQTCAIELERITNLLFDLEVPLDIGGKLHKFDLASKNKMVIAECKALTWTASGNIPAAKLTTLKEAVAYLRALSQDKERILLIQRDPHPKRGETLAAYFVRLNNHILGDVIVAEIPLEGGKPVILHGQF